MDEQHDGEVSDFAHGLKQQHLLCRTYGHSFAPFTVTVGRTEGKPSAYYEQTLRCKCGVLRRLLLSETGAVVSSSYKYQEADGYLVVGLGRIVGTRKDTLRLESLTRLIQKEG